MSANLTEIILFAVSVEVVKTLEGVLSTLSTVPGVGGVVQTVSGAV